ncbi:hypothetical protein LFM09_32990 [Lentzea alba]|uniref:hypothetical protein n=1 Tax=Lentzea alba TaxID=2714351 RepID=UPI0039BFF12C
MTGDRICHCCGDELSADNLAWDFVQPDDFANLSAKQRAKAITFESRVFIVAEGFGAATRVILPISLDTGHTVTLGVWVAPHDPDTMTRTAREGGAAWVGYRFTGTLLNAVEPWPEVIHTELTAQGFADGELARVVDAENPLLQRVLTEKWPHQAVVGARRA